MKFALCVAVIGTALAPAASALVWPDIPDLVAAFQAAEQPAARQAASLPPIGTQQPVDFWLPSKSGGRRAVQPFADHRPLFVTDGQTAFLRFDGKDDFLSLSNGRQLSPELTVFILAAPKANAGLFSGPFGAAEAAKNDYTSGLNVDFGPVTTPQLSVLNLESAGAGGFRDFLEPGKNLAADLPFGSFHVFTARSKIGPKGNELFLDGNKLDDRVRLESNIGLDEITIGSRIYSNDPARPPSAQGFFNGDIAAVAIYSRALNDSERLKVEEALFSLTPSLNALASGASGHSLETLHDPPPVQMLVPGFAVSELPAKLTNLTNIRYRHDGKLVALGYDGRIHLLTDANGDGDEETATIFWDKSVLRGPIGMVLLPANDPRGDGVYVASKGKVSLILDRNRDGVGDEEIVVSTGWKENFTNVDATGLAVDPKDGSIYFALGVENFADAYLHDPKTGKTNFRITSDRGTIQRVPADFSKRETVCTGVRFACALAFNDQGDLFASEQEGATWLPNGNPLDELLHIVPGRHYGFPPRHPVNLPEVIDEPAVMEYGPQHQSTVGMIFDEGVNGGPHFGPASWRGDALLCGESRGKLYRTTLVKTAEGYVGQNHLFACLSLLTVDACVTPRGDLLVACHSGPPDWGTGPKGDGRVFKIRQVKKDIPQPVHAWAASPDEFRIAFDRPLNPAEWTDARKKIRIEAGRYVSAGDRYEVIRPGYQVVRDQMASPRRWVEVQGISLSSDARTLNLRIPRQTEAVNYAVSLPVPKAWQVASPIAQQAEFDVSLTLNGVEATADAARTVLPHPDRAVAKAFTAGSAEHEAFFGVAEKAKATNLRSVVNIANIFQPATQPGSSLDWDIAKDAFANRRMTVLDGTQTISLKAGEGSLAALETSAAHPVFALDDRRRPIPLHRLFVPWATLPGQKASPAATARTDVKGNWLRGRRLFFGEGACWTCHNIRGEGTVFGPDLTNLVFRDRDSVTHDILQPSAAINPEQAGSTVTLTDGTVLSGILRTLSAEKMVLSLPAGASVERPRRDVDKVEPMKQSLMPERLTEKFTPEQMEDLLTFLLTAPLEPAPITRLDPGLPPARPMAEVRPFLSPQPASEKPLRVLISSGKKDHGLNEHDYPLFRERWSKLLNLADHVTVKTCEDFPGEALLNEADVAIFYSSNIGWNLGAAAVLDRYQRRGGGLVYLHWGMEGREFADALGERIGIATGLSAFRHGPLDLVFTNAGHPIGRGFSRLQLVDESYWKFHGDRSRIGILAHSVEETRPEPQIWTLEREKGRVFGCIPGHYTWTFDDPLYRILVLRGIAWAAGDPNVDRLLELTTVGARFVP